MATIIDTALTQFTGIVAAQGGFVFPSTQNFPASNQEQHPRRIYQQAGNAAAETRVIEVVTGLTGVVKSIFAGAVTAAAGGATATVDLKKNGTSILTAPISLSSSNAGYALVAGVLSSPTLSVNDVLTIVTTATVSGGTLATGLFAVIDMTEDKTS